jgi:hypothetical protein
MVVGKTNSPFFGCRFYFGETYCLFFRSLAFRALALAAALDALTAISLRLLALSFLARASPPSFARSERTRFANASSIRLILHLASKVRNTRPTLFS